MASCTIQALLNHGRWYMLARATCSGQDIWHAGFEVCILIETAIGFDLAVLELREVGMYRVEFEFRDLSENHAGRAITYVAAE